MKNNANEDRNLVTDEYLDCKGADQLSQFSNTCSILAAFKSSGKHIDSLVKDDNSLSDILKEVYKEYNQPAMAASLIYSENVIAKAVVGNIQDGDNKAVNINSLFHIGSIAKSMTSLLIAMLVNDGKLHYEMTLEQALPNIPMLDEYRKVTMHELLLNKAGIIAFQKHEYEEINVVKDLWKNIPTQYKDPKTQRIEVSKVVLNLKPVNTPGTKVLYSNVGWAIAALAAELAAGNSYEDLLKQNIFEKLGMKTTRTGGWPASEKEPNQPRGHYFDKENNKLKPQTLDDEFVLPSWANPSGGVNCDITDLTTYIRENLLGLQGNGKLLSKEYYKNIHSIHTSTKLNEMYMGIDTEEIITLGYGWVVMKVENDLLSMFDGSGGTFFARAIIYPALNLSFVGLTNTGKGNKALESTLKHILDLDIEAD